MLIWDSHDESGDRPPTGIVPSPVYGSRGGARSPHLLFPSALDRRTARGRCHTEKKQQSGARAPPPDLACSMRLLSQPCAAMPTEHVAGPGLCPTGVAVDHRRFLASRHVLRRAGWSTPAPRYSTTACRTHKEDRASRQERSAQSEQPPGKERSPIRASLLHGAGRRQWRWRRGQVTGERLGLPPVGESDLKGAGGRQRPQVTIGIAQAVRTGARCRWAADRSSCRATAPAVAPHSPPHLSRRHPPSER